MWVERIRDAHALDRFSCGNEAMDGWLSRFALDSERTGVSRTYILTEDGVEVIGYYTLAGMSAEQVELPRVLRRGTPPGVAQPGCLLRRLAVAETRQKQGLARDMTVDAVRVAAKAAELIGGRFIAVDPIDQRAREIYLNWGFQQIAGDANRRLYLSLEQARKDL